MITLNNWFECKIQYDKIGTEDGKQKKVTDTYLMDAVSFAEAEARIVEVVRPYMTGEFTVSNIKRSKYYEVFDAKAGDKWYKVKVAFIILDLEKGKEKRVNSTMLVRGEDIESARLNTIEGMNGTLSDYEIMKIEETCILDVIPYAMRIDEPNEESAPDCVVTE